MYDAEKGKKERQDESFEYLKSLFASGYYGEIVMKVEGGDPKIVRLVKNIKLGGGVGVQKSLRGMIEEE